MVAGRYNPLSISEVVPATYFALDGLDPVQAIDVQ